MELGEHNFEPIESPEQVKADADRARVLSALEEQSEPATADQLGDELDLPKRAARRYLNELLEKGLVVRDGRGRKNDPYVWRPAGTEDGTT